MQSIYQQIEINWPVRALFNYVSDINNNATWQTEVAETEWLGHERNTSGAQYKEVLRDTGNNAYAICQITEFIPYQKRSVLTENQLFTAASTWEFEQHEQRTVMKLTVQVRPRSMYTPVEPFAATKFLHERARDLFRLKKILESEE
ncbi:SRPBCC family protein [Ohtaekwangia sp.]|uniref:SRPBCC family protein n=1 Tax=Ohtaekwangia sp. TaxID=2066019 RepID=UPI002FDCEEC7